MEALILDLVSKFPVAATIVMVIGILRIINKPIFSLLKSVADATPTPADNAAIEAIEQSKIYKMVSFALDWFGSVKLPEKK